MEANLADNLTYLAQTCASLIRGEDLIGRKSFVVLPVFIETVRLGML